MKCPYHTWSCPICWTLRAAVVLFILAVVVATCRADIPRDPFIKPRTPTFKEAKHKNGGRWYMAADGHAVYCYGPKMLVRNAVGDIEPVATFCRDGRSIVPLKQ